MAHPHRDRRAPRGRRIRAVHHPGRSVSRLDEQPGGRRHRGTRVAAHRGRTARHLPDRARDARPAEQGRSPIAVEARVVDGDDRLHRRGADVSGASAGQRARAAALGAAAARRAAAVGAARDGVWRAVPVHALRTDERDGAQGPAGVGDQGADPHHSRRERGQHVGWPDEAVSDRHRSRPADAVRVDAPRRGNACGSEQHELRRRLHRTCRRAVHVAGLWPSAVSGRLRQHRPDLEGRDAGAAEGRRRRAHWAGAALRARPCAMGRRPSRAR